MLGRRDTLIATLVGVGLHLAVGAGGAFAQDAKPAAAEPAAAAAPGAPTAPAAAAPAEAEGPVEAQSGPKVTTQQHGDWLLECYDPAVNNVSCQIKQRIVQQDGDRNILVMSLAFDPQAKTNVVQYVLPLDFLLTPGVSVEVENYQSVVGVNRCAAQGCFVEGTADQGFIDAMRAARAGGRVVIVSRTGQKVGIGFSAAGFSKAYDEMVKENTRLAQAQPDAKPDAKPAASN